MIVTYEERQGHNIRNVTSDITCDQNVLIEMTVGTTDVLFFFTRRLSTKYSVILRYDRYCIIYNRNGFLFITVAIFSKHFRVIPNYNNNNYN